MTLYVDYEGGSPLYNQVITKSEFDKLRQLDKIAKLNCIKKYRKWHNSVIDYQLDYERIYHCIKDSNLQNRREILRDRIVPFFLINDF